MPPRDTSRHFYMTQFRKLRSEYEADKCAMIKRCGQAGMFLPSQISLVSPSTKQIKDRLNALLTDTPYEYQSIRQAISGYVAQIEDDQNEPANQPLITARDCCL